MILGEKDKMFDAAFFVEVLQKSLENVLRITTTNSGTMCTGWLLTKDLVVIPNFMGKEKDHFLCYPFSKVIENKTSISAALIYQSSADEDGVSLLRLENARPLINPQNQLVLQMANCAIGDPLFILHHPEGNPKTFLSFGKVLESGATFISYDADTRPGSGGAPVFNTRTGELIAMHSLSDRNKSFNSGVAISKILEHLRKSDHWNEINTYHKIVDIQDIGLESYQFEWKAIHREAALSWNIERIALSEQEQLDLKPYVVNTDALYWTMKPDVRTTIFQSTDANVLKDTSIKRSGHQTGQQIIDCILKGGPYNLEEIDENELPFWLQAVRWFVALDPKLPSSAAVNRVLERKRIRSRLSMLSRDDFKGRAKEIQQLKAWYQSKDHAPLMVSGIGGIGKSALISHFILSLPQNTPILWLDFDRVDLAPDDALSVLNALVEQIAVQIDGFSAPAKEGTWELMASQLGESFSKALAGLPLPLLVLDGFEVAQNVKQYTEIWKMLEHIIDKCPELKIIVSGRAFVSSLKLKEKTAESIVLTGMEAADAKALLAQHAIEDEEIVNKVIEMSRGIPLVLKLAIHYIESGGKLKDLPNSLPKVLVEGYLYQRILDRVMDPKLKPIAWRALVLRKITLEIIKEILRDCISEALNDEQIFEGLSREMGLIAETGFPSGLGVLVSNQRDALQLRPELRLATIKLLELENPELVKEIDLKAIDFYCKQNLDNSDNRAELIYHLLRSGELNEAKKYWQTECAPLLQYAIEDLPEAAAAERTWLQSKVDQLIGETKDDVIIWELETLEQIKKILKRGHYDKVQGCLKERAERSESSPLLLYDAWWLWRKGKVKEANSLLENSHPTKRELAENQKIFQAFLAYYVDDILLADQLLSTIETEQWANHQEGPLKALALKAARVRLSVDLNAELSLIWLLRNDRINSNELKRALNSKDVIIPYLIEYLSESSRFESKGSYMEIPITEQGLQAFSHVLNNFSKNSPSNQAKLPIDSQDLKSLFDLFAPYESIKSLQTSFKLALLGDFRWKYTTQSLMLADFAKLANKQKEEIDPLEMAVIISLAAYRGIKLAIITDGFKANTIDGFLKTVIQYNLNSLVPPLSGKRKKILDRYMSQEKEYDRQSSLLFDNTQKELSRQNDPSHNYSSFKFLATASVYEEETVAMIAYLYGPDPLEMLLRRIIGLPNNYKF